MTDVGTGYPCVNRTSMAETACGTYGIPEPKTVDGIEQEPTRTTQPTLRLPPRPRRT